MATSSSFAMGAYLATKNPEKGIPEAAHGGAAKTHAASSIPSTLVPSAKNHRLATKASALQSSYCEEALKIAFIRSL